MTLIRKKQFLDIFAIFKEIELFIGMGNPDAEIHLVGCETKDEGNQDIINHEIKLNYSHWQDIVNHHNHLADPFDPILSSRAAPFKDFNPFSPLLYKPTLAIVNEKYSGRTYAGMDRMIQSIFGNTTLTARETGTFDKSIFSKTFISEINHTPAKNQNVSNFDLKDHLKNDSFDRLIDEFYKSFKTTILYCGKNDKYVDKTNSEARSQIISRYLPGTLQYHLIDGIEVYSNEKGQKVILTRHFSSGFGNDMAQKITAIINLTL